jgi:anti-sigma regulatory factor (Ser/Thr protein kinase)
VARPEHDVVLTLPANGAFVAVARQAALELARRRGFEPSAHAALEAAVGEAFDQLGPSEDQVRLTFAIDGGAIVISAALLEHPARSFRRAVPGR